jgi:hypothetical protein
LKTYIQLLLIGAALFHSLERARATPDAQAFLAYTQHFTNPARGPEFVMPVGSGDLSAMVSFDSALQLHFSKSDWLGHPQIGAPTTNAAGANITRKATAMSPGHLTLTPANLTAADIRSFDQYMDFGRGCVVLKIGTEKGPLEMEVFGDMGHKALVIKVRDGRSQQGASIVRFSNWRETMKIGSNGAALTGEEIHPPNGKDTSDVALHNLGLGVAIGSHEGTIKEGALEIPVSKSGEYDVVVTAEVTRDGTPLPPALAKLREILSENPVTLRDTQLTWWKNFWEQSWVLLRGDKDAEYLTRLWLTDMYTYAGIFGGRLPPTFTGASLLVMKDYNSWEGAYTWQNTRELIWPMAAANHLGYADLYFRTYDRHFLFCQDHARQIGKTGIRVPEYVYLWQDPQNQGNTNPIVKQPTPFDRKKIEDQTDQKLEQGGGSHTSHILGDGGELTQLMFDHVRYTGDEKFLKEVCAPWLRECTLFYLNYLKLGSDGLWHMTPSNAAETWWKVKDPMTDMCAAHYCLEQTVKHGAEFGYEPELIAMAKERLDKLAPLPVGRWKERKVTPEEIAEFKKKFPNIRLCAPIHFDGIDRNAPYFAPASDIGDYPSRNNWENPDLYNVFPYARVVIDGPEGDLQRGINTFNERRCTNTYGWSPDGVQAARLGLTNTAEVILDHAQKQQTYPYGGWKNCAANLPGSTTKGVTDTPQLDTAGVNQTAIQEMLLQSHDITEKEQLLDGGPIRLLPAIRKDWSGSFRLRARGGFLVTCAFEKGMPTSVTILSERGRTLRLVNAFPSCDININGQPISAKKDRLIELPTKSGDRIELTKGE